MALRFQQSMVSKYGCPFIPILVSSHAAGSEESSTGETDLKPLPKHDQVDPETNPSTAPVQKKSLSYNLIADAVEKVSPSVVFIEGALKNPPPQPLQQRRRGKREELSPPEQSKVSGSGFVVSENGIVLTSAHVVSGVSSIKITFPNEQKTYDSYIIDSDQETDIAALKLVVTENEEVKFPAAQLGRSADVRVGEWVAALGSPLGLSNTVTSGIVSTLDRQSAELGLQGGSKDLHYIQTDTAINIGNSGGPLINLDGEVIGINCITIYPASGISFAVPSDVVRSFLDEALKIEASFNNGGKATTKYPKRVRFFIGVSMLTITPALLAELKSKKREAYESIEHGVFVAAVNPGSPADRCGLVAGDIIVSVNDVTIKKSSDLFAEVQKGDLMILKVQRGLKSLVLYVKPEIVSRL